MVACVNRISVYNICLLHPTWLCYAW